MSKFSRCPPLSFIAVFLGLALLGARVAGAQQQSVALGLGSGFAADASGQAKSDLPANDSMVLRESAKTSIPDGSRMRMVFRGERFEARYASVAMLLDYAYGLGLGAPIAGGPDWIRSARFDMDAAITPVAPGDPDVTFGRVAQPSLIAALQQEFHLAAHLEPRPGKGLALVVAKGRARLKLAASNNPGGPHVWPAGFGVLEGRAATMDELASALASGSMPPVENRTGLTGRYDFTLHWSPSATVNRDDDASARYNMDGSISARVSDTRCVPGQEASGCNLDEALPPLAMALEAELGLKLEPAKTTLQALVIDHIERPAR